jgi:mannosyltransferase
MTARAAALAVAGLAVMAALLRAFAATPGFLGDELYTFDIASRDDPGDVVDGVLDGEDTPPLYYLLAWGVGKVLGPPEWMRLPALLAGVALVPVCALLARRVFGLGAALVAALVVALSPFLVYFGSEARAYAPAALCVAVATLLLLAALERPRAWLWTGYAVAGAAGLWLHYTAALPLAAQAVWALWSYPERRRGLLAASVGTLLLYAPWLPYLGERTPVELAAAFNPRTTGDRIDALLRPLIGHPYKELGHVPGVPLALLAAGAVAVAAVAALRRRPLRLPDRRRPVWALVLTALAAPAWVVAYTAFDANVFSPRYLVVSAPAALVLLAGLVGGRHAAVAVPMAGVLALVMGVTAIRTAFGDLRRPAYDDAAALIDRVAGPEDPVIELPFAPVEGAWRRALSAFLDEPHALFGADRPGAEGGWAAARRRGVAYVLYPDTLLLAPPRPPRGSRLVPVERRVWRGTTTLTLVTYRRR